MHINLLNKLILFMNVTGGPHYNCQLYFNCTFLVDHAVWTDFTRFALDARGFICTTSIEVVYRIVCITLPDLIDLFTGLVLKVRRFLGD